VTNTPPNTASSPGASPEPSLGSGLRGHMPDWSTSGPLLLAAAGLFAYWRIIEYDPSAGARNVVSGAEGFFFSPTGTYPGLLLVLTAWLLYRRRGRLALAMQLPRGAVAPLCGFAMMLLAAALATWAHYVDTLSLLIPSMSLMMFGGGLFLGGAEGGRATAVPAVFLLLAYPSPPALHNQLVWPMQLATASVAASVLNAVGIEATHSGDLIMVGGERLYQVIESCAGLRSIGTLLMSAFVYAEIFHRRGLRAALLIVAAPLLGLMINHLRVLSIVMNPWSDVGFVHTTQGLAMLVMGVLAIALLDRVIGRRLPARFDPRWRLPEAALAGERVSPSAWRAIALFYLFIVIGGLATWMPRWEIEAPQDERLYSLKPRLGDWQGLGVKLDERFLGSVGYTDWVYRRYEHDGVEARVFIGADSRLEPRLSSIPPKNEIPGVG